MCSQSTNSRNEDDVVRLLIDYIKVKKLKENDRVPAIREFAEINNFNPSVVRSGYLRAATIGIIRMHQRSGAFVQRIDFDRISEFFRLLVDVSVGQNRPKVVHFYDVRTIIEAETFRIAARRAASEDLHDIHETLAEMQQLEKHEDLVAADENFHLAVARVSRNPILDMILQSIFAMIRPHRVAFEMDEEDYADMQADHAKLYNALLEHDEEEATRLAALHSDRRKQELLSIALQRK